MIVTADASFLVSLYGGDVNAPAARAWMSANAEPVLLTGALRFEAENALRLACFRGRLTPAELKQSLTDIESDLRLGSSSPSHWTLTSTGQRLGGSAQPTPVAWARELTISHTWPRLPS